LARSSPAFFAVGWAGHIGVVWRCPPVGNVLMLTTADVGLGIAARKGPIPLAILAAAHM